MSAPLLSRIAIAALVAAAAGAAQAQTPGFVGTVPGGGLTDPSARIPGTNDPVRNPPPIAGPIQGRGAFPAWPNSIQGRWSASTACVQSATQLTLTASSMELSNRSGRLYYANVALVQQGTDYGALVTSSPNVNRMGSAGGQLGDTYVFRLDSANRIVPVAIQRATARRDRVGAGWPAFYRCR